MMWLSDFKFPASAIIISGSEAWAASSTNTCEARNLLFCWKQDDFMINLEQIFVKNIVILPKMNTSLG